MAPHTPLFPELPQAHINLIAGYGVTRSCPKNSILIHEGDRSDSLFVIKSGKVKVYVSDPDGKEATLNVQGPGEYFGELALIDEAPRSASVVTLEPSQLAVLSRGDFERCLAENPSIAVELIRSLVQRVRALTESVKDLALLDVYGRVARTLLKSASEIDGELQVRERLTHQDIANMVGASREMVSRVMKDLADGGYIRVRGKVITIPGELSDKVGEG